MLSEKEIRCFQIIYKQKFGKEIGREEALEKGLALIRLIELTYKAITKEEYEKYKPKQFIRKS